MNNFFLWKPILNQLVAIKGTRGDDEINEFIVVHEIVKIHFNHINQAFGRGVLGAPIQKTVVEIVSLAKFANPAMCQHLIVRAYAFQVMGCIDNGNIFFFNSYVNSIPELSSKLTISNKAHSFKISLSEFVLNAPLETKIFSFEVNDKHL